jgi:hypothetical protein
VDVIECNLVDKTGDDNSIGFRQYIEVIIVLVFIKDCVRGWGQDIDI